MDDYRRIKLGCDLSAQLTAMWMAEGAELLDFEMILCHVLSAQIVGAAHDYKMDPVKLANIIHHFTLKFIEKTK